MRVYLSALLSLSLSLALLAPSTVRAEASAEDRGGARRLLEAGKEAFRAARFDEAAKLFAEAYAKDASLDAALFNQAYALRRGERYADAREAYRRYLALHPDDLDTHYALARTSQLLGDVEDARKWYASYVEKETRTERARYLEHAKAQLAILPAPAAPAVVEEAPAEPAYDAAARFAEAMQRYQEKRYRDAAVIFLELFEHDAEHTRALYRHALALRQAGELDGARAAYERFLTLEPSDPDAVFGLAETERASGNTERAITLYERYLEVERRPSEEPWRERAREYIAVLRPSLETPAVVVEEPGPEAPAAPVVVQEGYGPGDAHRPRLVRTAAPSPLSEGPEEEPTPALELEALLAEGEAKLAEKDGARALVAFQRALAAEPSSARVQWGLARAYEQTGQTSAAKHHYRLYRVSPAADRDPAKADTAWWKIESLP